MDAVINFSIIGAATGERERSIQSARASEELPTAQEDDELRCCSGLCGRADGLPARSRVIMAGRLDPTRPDPTRPVLSVLSPLFIGAQKYKEIEIK